MAIRCIIRCSTEHIDAFHYAWYGCFKDAVYQIYSCQWGFQGVQGIGAAGIAPLVMIIIGDIVPLRERGKYQASMHTYEPFNGGSL